MRAKVIKLGGGPLLAVALAIAANGGASAAEIPDGDWEGRWYPKNSCRDTRERKVTAHTEGGHIRGEVHNPPADPGVFAADIEASGRFVSTVAGLKRYGFSVNGRATPSEISATWEGRDDCGNGTFVLSLLGGGEGITGQQQETEPPAAVAEPAPEEDGAAIDALNRLYEQGLITEEEYQAKVAALEPEAAAPAEAEEADPARAALDRLYDQGLITEEEYQAKLKALEPEQPAMKTAPPEQPKPDSRLVELDDLLTNGEISADEYLERRAAITGGN